MKDKVSIIIPTYNRATLLRETLESVLDQTHKNWECIIIDDGSDDNTEALIKDYLGKDKRFSFIKRSKTVKKGASSCRNLGLQRASGHYIQFLDSDDLMAPTKISDQLTFLKRHSEEVIACSSWKLFSDKIERDNSEYIEPLKEEFFTGCSFLENLGRCNSFYPPHCYLVSKEIIERAGLWNEDLTNNDDGEYFTRVILASSGVHLVNKADVFYRRSGTDNLSGYSNRSRVLSVIKSWKLIQEHLSNKCRMESLIYVKTARQQLFQTLKNRFPRTVAEHKDFFAEQFIKEPHRLNKFFIFKRSFGNSLRNLKRKLF